MSRSGNKRTQNISPSGVDADLEAISTSASVSDEQKPRLETPLKKEKTTTRGQPSVREPSTVRFKKNYEEFLKSEKSKHSREKTRTQKQRPVSHDGRIEPDNSKYFEEYIPPITKAWMEFPPKQSLPTVPDYGTIFTSEILKELFNKKNFNPESNQFELHIDDKKYYHDPKKQPKTFKYEEKGKPPVVYTYVGTEEYDKRKKIYEGKYQSEGRKTLSKKRKGTTRKKKN